MKKGKIGMSDPLTKDNNTDYEHIQVDKEKLKEKGITGSIRSGGWSFKSADPLLKGEKASEIEEDLHKKDVFVNSDTVIPGLRCPDCAACAHETDVPGVATCCQPIGWYFFYRRLNQDVSSKARLVIRNGELVLEENTDKQESSF